MHTPRKSPHSPTSSRLRDLVDPDRHASSPSPVASLMGLRLGCLAALLIAFTGCAGRLEATVRQNAAEDLPCGSDSITVTRLPGGGATRGTYAVEGCGLTGEYLATCSILCNARSQQQRAQDEGRRQELMKQEGERQERERERKLREGR